MHVQSTNPIPNLWPKDAMSSFSLGMSRQGSMVQSRLTSRTRISSCANSNSVHRSRNSRSNLPSWELSTKSESAVRNTAAWWREELGLVAPPITCDGLRSSKSWHPRQVSRTCREGMMSNLTRRPPGESASRLARESALSRSRTRRQGVAKLQKGKSSVPSTRAAGRSGFRRPYTSPRVQNPSPARGAFVRKSRRRRSWSRRVESEEVPMA